MTSKEALKILEFGGIGYRVEDKEKALSVINNDLENFEWLKSKLNLKFLDSLSTIEDKFRLLKIMGLELYY